MRHCLWCLMERLRRNRPTALCQKCAEHIAAILENQEGDAGAAIERIQKGE